MNNIQISKNNIIYKVANRYPVYNEPEVYDICRLIRIGVILVVGTISASIPITCIYLNSLVTPLDTHT